MRTRRAVAAVGATVLLSLVAVPGGVAAAAPGPPCPNASVPGPAVDTSEVPRPGGAAPAPLPVPANPVGGPAMGTCGDAVAPGAPPAPGVGVVSYVLADLDTGTVLAARNPHARLRPASLMKTLTGLVAVRRLDMNAPIAGTPEDVDQDGTRVGIGPGAQYTTGQMVDAMLMASGNDATHALATALGGDAATVTLMNDTARSVGALDTRTATPSGLDGPGMQSSAYDLASIFRIGMREPAFAHGTGNRTMTLPGWGGQPPVPVSNDNKLMGAYPGAIGGKTGFTDDARHTYIGAAERNGHRLVVVLMRGEQRPEPMYQQGIDLLDYGFAHAGGPGIGTLTDAPLPGARSGASTDPVVGSPVTAGDGGGWSARTTAFAIAGVAFAGALLLLGVRRRNRT